MQEKKVYAGDHAPVKTSLQRVTCRIACRGGVLRLAGTLDEVLTWLRAHCPTGKMTELARLSRLAEVQR